MLTLKLHSVNPTQNAMLETYRQSEAKPAETFVSQAGNPSEEPCRNPDGDGVLTQAPSLHMFAMLQQLG